MSSPILGDPPREEFRTLNGIRHHLLVWDARPDAPTLVVLHGWLDLAWSFAPFVTALRRLAPIRVVAVDLRGHGETDWVGPGAYYHFSDYVADVHELLTSLGGCPHLLGHSMGGTLASLVAGAFPELVDHLVLAEGLGPPHDHDDPPERVARWIREVSERRSRPPKPMPSIADAARRLRDSNSRLTEDLSLFVAQKGTRSAGDGLVWRYDPLHRTRSPQSFVIEQYRAFLRQIRAKTLIVVGAESGFGAFIDDGRAIDLAEHTTVELAESGHMMHHDQPEAFAAAVARFLAP